MDQIENNIKWFMQFQGKVQGPFNTDSLQSTIDHLDSHHLEATLLWRRGFAEWIKASKWKPSEHTSTMTMTQPMPQSYQQTVAAPDVVLPPPPRLEKIISDEETVVGVNAQKPKPLDPGAFYKVQVNFVDQPLMSKMELLNLIAKQEDISVVAIQDQKTKEWKEVYAFPDIVEKLGLSRRKHPRVPILAQFSGKSNRHTSFLARIITISEGGFGLTEVYDLKIGDEVEGQMTSPHFFQPINIRADVVYSGLDGYIGLNFSQINDESKAAIIDYMKKFGKSSTGNPSS